MPVLDQQAPPWARQFADDLDRELSRLAAAARGPVALPVYRRTTVPPAQRYRGCMIYVEDAVDGGTPAFSDGAVWRRTADRQPIE